MARLAAVVLGVLLIALPAGARSADADLCDALAGDDPALGLTVPLETIDAAPALAACMAAVEQDPANPRLIHQYARALERSGRLDDARRLYGWAAADGYGPAALALDRLEGIAPAGQTAWAEEDRLALAEGMAALSSTLRRYASTLPSDPTDPLTVLAETGTDRTAILRWVADNTRLVAYVGSLRGPRGVLADRAGNSLDRALVLADLLVHAGEEVRIAHAMLGDADAQALLTATGRTIAVPALAPPPAEALGALLDDARLDRDLVEAITADILDRRARIDDLVEDRAELLLPPLMEAARPAEGAASAAARDAALAAIRDYYWVQVRSGVAWLDVSPDTAVIAVPAAEETFAPADLPDTLRHTVTLRVIVELEDAAGRHEETLLTWTGAPADLDGGVFALSHDGQGLDALDQVAATADAEARMLAILDGVTAWTPILRANGELVVENFFTRDGTVRPVDATAFTATGGAAGALFAEAATVLGGGEQAMVEPATPTAEWLEIEINVPGEAPRIERRTIFDMIGPAARNAGATVAFTADQLRDRALRLLGATEILIVGATPSDVEVTLRGAAALAEVADNIGAFANQPEPPTMGNFPFTPRIGMTLLRFASTRLPAASLTAVASPNVFLTHDRLAWDPKSGIVRQIAFDIVFNEVTAPADVFTTRVRQGLVDTILEDALMAEGRSANTAAFHAADVAADLPWRTLTAADGAALAALPPDTRALMEAQMAAGATIVAPVAWTDVPPGLSWWRIDQRTGTTLGMLPFGGLSLIEGAYLFYQGATTAACFFIVAASVRAAIGGNLSTELAAIGMLACAGAMAGGAAAATGAGGFGTAAAGAAGGTGLAGAATILAALLAQAIW